MNKKIFQNEEKEPEMRFDLCKLLNDWNSQGSWNCITDPSIFALLLSDSSTKINVYLDTNLETIFNDSKHPNKFLVFPHLTMGLTLSDLQIVCEKQCHRFSTFNMKPYMVEDGLSYIQSLLKDYTSRKRYIGNESSLISTAINI